MKIFYITKKRGYSAKEPIIRIETKFHGENGVFKL